MTTQSENLSTYIVLKSWFDMHDIEKLQQTFTRTYVWPTASQMFRNQLNVK